MTDAQLFTRISSLPADLKKELADFAAFLKQKANFTQKIKERIFTFSPLNLSIYRPYCIWDLYHRDILIAQAVSEKMTFLLPAIPNLAVTSR